MTTPATSRERAIELDRADPLAQFRDRFVPTEPGVVYLDGNSLGRPTKASIERVAAVSETWSRRLIRGWEDGWLELPLVVGDQLAAGVLGARPGEVPPRPRQRQITPTIRGLR